MDLVQFAAERSARLEAADAELESLVRQALSRWGMPDWTEPIVTGASVLFLEIFERENPDAPAEANLASFQRDLADTLRQTKQPDARDGDVQVERIKKWVGTYTVNAATFFANRGRAATKTWVTMGDSAVRETHRAANGQSVPVGAEFNVGGVGLRFPGEPVGPPELWINCRCLLAAQVMEGAAMDPQTFEMDADMDREPDDVVEDMDGEDLVDELDEIPVHGILAPEGVVSGDGRMFAGGALSTRDLPIPLLFQTMSGDGGHTNSVAPGRIDKVWRTDDGMMAFEGALNPNHERADEIVDGIIFGNIRGLSVDLDEYEVQAPEYSADGEAEETMVFSRGRIAGATIVAIPAFPEAFVALGPYGEDSREEAVEDVIEDDDEAMVASAAPQGAREEAQRGIDWVAEGHGGSGLEPATIERARKIASGADLTDDHVMRMHSFFARHEVNKGTTGWSPGDKEYPSPGRVAWALWGGDAGKSFADAEAKRIMREREAATAALLAGGEFAPGTKDGPGWITNPRATARIRRYWTRGKGAAKIRWGAPGDFNRCRRQLAKYVSPVFLAGTCANMHKEALGVWPGRHRGDKGLAADGVSLSLVAAAPKVLDAEWFKDPQLEGPTPVTVTDDGRIFGHLATWGTCHIGFENVCTTPPTSRTNYAMFRLGAVSTTEGEVAVGQITLGTGHASLRAGVRAAAAHYDNTGLAVADVAAGEDGFGIWIAGAVRETLTSEELRELKASKLSGDWRKVGGNLELVAALAVNVPGFPVPRTALAASGGQQTALVASGIVEDNMAAIGTTSVKVSLDVNDAVGLVAAVADELETRQERRARLAAARKAYDEELSFRQRERARRAAEVRRSLEGVDGSL